MKARNERFRALKALSKARFDGTSLRMPLIPRPSNGTAGVEIPHIYTFISELEDFNVKAELDSMALVDLVRTPMHRAEDTGDALDTQTLI